MPVKVEGGRIETVLIEQPGPIAYIESTTLSKILDEDANRCITMHTDEQSSQTRRIIRSIAKTHVGPTDEVVKHRIKSTTPFNVCGATYQCTFLLPNGWGI